jgi:murein DD-endopeptidase MepM/ murein hydrolase activator NlpD
MPGATECGQRASAIDRGRTGLRSRQPFDHAHRVGSNTPSFAPPSRIGNRRINPSRHRRRKRLSILVFATAAVIVAALGVSALAWAQSTKVTSSGVAASPTLAPTGPSQMPLPTGSGVAAVLATRDSDPPAGGWSPATVGPASPSELTGYVWPLEHARITNAFGAGRPGNEVVDGVVMHDGIDISNFCGAHVVAAHDGVVLAAGHHYEGFVGWVGDLGPYRARLDAVGWRRTAIAVVIDDGNGYRSIYLHLNLTTVRPGDIVRAGDMIGYEGNTGESTGCHLHYSLFSPRSRYTIGLDPKVAKETRLPDRKIMRIDPLLVLPPLEDGFITWNWGAGGPS